MQDKYTNIYKIARNTAGKTQERFAEMLGLSVESMQSTTRCITPL